MVPRLLPGHAGAGGARSRAISDKISWNICRGTATSAIWKTTYRQWLTTFAPILISFLRRLVSDHGSAVFGIASVRMKLPRLYARTWSWRRTALAAKVRHDNRVHLIAPLPSLIHCSAVPRRL